MDIKKIKHADLQEIHEYQEIKYAVLQDIHEYQEDQVCRPLQDP